MKSKSYVETGCCVDFQGFVFDAGGAVVNDDRCIAYLGNDGVLTDWHGRPIGRYTVTSSWRAKRSWLSDVVMQVRAVVDGRTFLGRSCGLGMIFRGRRSAAEARLAAS